MMRAPRVRDVCAFSLLLVFLYFTTTLLASGTYLPLSFYPRALLVDDTGNQSHLTSETSSNDKEIQKARLEAALRAAEARLAEAKAGLARERGEVRVVGALLELQPGSRIPGFDELCALSNTSIADGCTLMSVGKPIGGYESLAWRARNMQGEWLDIFKGAPHDGEDVCATPLNCALGNATFVAVRPASLLCNNNHGSHIRNRLCFD